jgi:hypothetical protein
LINVRADKREFIGPFLLEWGVAFMKKIYLIIGLMIGMSGNLWAVKIEMKTISYLLKLVLLQGKEKVEQLLPWYHDMMPIISIFWIMVYADMLSEPDHAELEADLPKKLR